MNKTHLLLPTMNRDFYEFPEKGCLYISKEMLQYLTKKEIDSLRIDERVIGNFYLYAKVPNPTWMFWKPKYKGVILKLKEIE